jgi:undecaprenyl-diphosphatase
MKRISKQSIIKLAVLVVLLAVIITFTAFVYAYNKEALPIDAVIRDFAYQIRGGKEKTWVFYIVRVITELGDYTGVFITLLLVGIFTKFDERFFILAFAALTMHLSNSAFKNIVERARPFAEYMWQHESSTSFPSGHSATAGVLYTSCLLYVLNSNASQKIKLIAKIGFPIIILVVMSTRIVLGVHYFSDVVTGASFGALIAILYSFVLPYAHKLYEMVVSKIKTKIVKNNQ